MSTRSTGQVLERSGSHGRVYALRFQAYGQRRYLTLGSEAEGWTRTRAGEELQNVLSDVRRAIWVPPGARGRWKPAAEVERANCFGPFAHALLVARRGQVAPATIRYMEWSFSHLMPYFTDWPLGEIDVRAVDAYRAHKVKESQARREALERGRPKRGEEGRVLRALSASSINKTIDNLQWVLSIALEQGRIETNPAVGRRRRLKEPRPSTRHLDSPTQIEALLEAASQLDRDPRCLIGDRHPIVATFLFAGLRAHELGSLRWRDVDLDSARISVTRSKTPAGLREISLFPVLAEVLRHHRSSSTSTNSGTLVFPARSGGERSKDNLRERVLLPALAQADQLLEARGQSPLPAGLSTHWLRAYICLDPGRRGRGPRFSHGPARPHRPGVQPPRVHAHDAPRSGRARAPACTGHGWESLQRTSASSARDCERPAPLAARAEEVDSREINSA